VKNMLAKNAVKTKNIIAMLAFGASALAVNASFGDNWGGLGMKDDHLPSSLPQTIRLNQDGKLEPISAVPEPATVSAVPEILTISTVPKLMTVSTTYGLITILPAPGLITIPAVPGLMTIPAAFESTTASELSERMAVSDEHELMAISDAPGRLATSDLDRLMANSDAPKRAPVSAVPEPTTIFAGALLLLPLGVSIVRNLRRNKKCGNQNG
jgi:hypothetical protein